jgi:hypothetical protein
MIDSEGFQHSGDICEYYEFCNVVMPGTGQVVEAHFPWPELVLEAHAKARGWVWFEALPEGVIPHRFIFKFDVFEPGQTAGWVKDCETLEFVLSRYEKVSMKELP